ncbi:uncharacterized protein BBOV_IV000410 [Babesia bovis T2Bo]|uniref:Surface protein D n=1 Tax=Babesia bovis TaxID=5865 RepID=A7AV15_BABBO|nr:uncharacterized protein BBOV_IV000410 [Babesia bovis T2Bo]EDO05641.1 hypothetical protein BBOV_IV000410 [Babesia bovis T2Bo]|eukprot:XP_001609209.1 surface protein D [Babesia bovis T2Bo]
MLSLKFSLLSLFFSAFIAGIKADGPCSDADLAALGFHLGSPIDDMIPKLKVSTKAIRKVMMGNLTSVSESNRPAVADKIAKELSKGGISGVDGQCLLCFAGSAQCVASKCKGACVSSEYSKQCQSCIMEHCHASFVSCVGQETVNPAQHKDMMNAK